MSTTNEPIKLQITLAIDPASTESIIGLIQDCLRQSQTIRDPLPVADAPEVTESPLLSITELSQRLQISKQSIKIWLKEGLPHIPAGRRPRFRFAACEDWLMQRAEHKRAHQQHLRRMTAGLHPTANGPAAPE